MGDSGGTFNLRVTLGRPLAPRRDWDPKVVYPHPRRNPPYTVGFRYGWVLDTDPEINLYPRNVDISSILLQSDLTQPGIQVTDPGTILLLSCVDV